MTEIKLTANIKYPTKKINEESIQPLLKDFQKQLKEFMKKNLPATKKVVVTPVKKKDLINVKLPEDYVKTLCGICDTKFKTAHKQKYCATCRLTMVKERMSASALYVKLHPNIKATYKSLDDRLKNVTKLIEDREQNSLTKKVEELERTLVGIEKFENKTVAKPDSFSEASRRFRATLPRHLPPRARPVRPSTLPRGFSSGDYVRDYERDDGSDDYGVD